MGSLIPIYKDRTNKPPSGTLIRTDGHWSVYGLVSAFSFTTNKTNETLGELLPGRLYSGAITGAAFSQNSVVFGDNTSHRVITNCNHVSGNFSIVAIVRYNAIPAGGVIYSVDNSTFGAVCPHLFISTSTGKIVYQRLAKDIAAYGTAATPGSMADGKPHVAIATVSGGNHVLWVDGIKYTGTTTETSAYVTSNVMLGCVKSSAGNYVSSMGGILSYTALYSRVLNDGECYALCLNPWLVYAPEVTFKSLSQNATWTGTGGAVFGGTSGIITPGIIRPSGGLVAGGMSPLGMLYNGNTKVVRTDNDYSFTMSNTTKRFTMKEV